MFSLSRVQTALDPSHILCNGLSDERYRIHDENSNTHKSVLSSELNENPAVRRMLVEPPHRRDYVISLNSSIEHRNALATQ